MKRFVSILLIISAAAGAALVLLARDKIAGTPILPGFDTGLSSETSDAPGRRLLTLRTEAGDLNCWLRLKFKSPPADNTPFVAYLAEEGLRTGRSKDGQYAGWLDVFVPDKNPSGRGKIKWPNGATIALSCGEDATSSLELDDWILYLEKDTDRRSFAIRRTLLYWVSALLLIGSIPAAITVAVRAFKQPSGQPVTPQLVVHLLIESIEGRSEAETKKMRSVLSKVILQGVSVSEALDHSVSGPLASRHLFWFKARNAFLNRLGFLIRQLGTYHARLRATEF